MADHDKDASDTETGRPLGYGNVDARPPIDGFGRWRHRAGEAADSAGGPAGRDGRRGAITSGNEPFAETFVQPLPML